MINISPHMSVHSPGPEPEALRARVQEDFAKIFMGVILGALRDATPAQGLLDSRDSAHFRAMLDEALLQQKHNWQALGAHLAAGLPAEKRRP